MQATERMAGRAGPSGYQAAAALLVATTLVVGLALAAGRISIGGAAAPAAAPAPDAVAVQRALNAHRLGEKSLVVQAPGGLSSYWSYGAAAGTPTSGDVQKALNDHRLGEKQALTTSNPIRGYEWDQAHHRFTAQPPATSPAGPDALRGGIQVR